MFAFHKETSLCEPTRFLVWGWLFNLAELAD